MKLLKILVIGLIIILTIGCIYINYSMEKETQNNEKILSSKEFAIVLGASVHGDELSGALRGRMNVAIELYKKGLVKNILLSGDGTDEYYNETAAMRKFALSNGIPQESLLTDEKGLNTYATMLRAHEVFNAKSAYIITQNFHLVRAVWVARECGIEAEGVSAGSLKDPWYYNLREFFARVKDYVLVMLKV